MFISPGSLPLQWPVDAAVADQTQGSPLGWQMAACSYCMPLAHLGFQLTAAMDSFVLFGPTSCRQHQLQVYTAHLPAVCSGLLWCYVSSVDRHLQVQSYLFRGTLLRGTAYTSLEVQVELSPIACCSKLYSTSSLSFIPHPPPFFLFWVSRNQKAAMWAQVFVLGLILGATETKIVGAIFLFLLSQV